MKWGAVIVAAGRGTRMGTADNKAYLPIAERPVLAHTLEAFERCGRVEEIVIVAAGHEIGRAEELVRAGGFAKVAAVVAGGAERQDSVEAGLSALGTDGALIHDAARPLVTPEQIAACLEAAEEHGASTLAVPVKDTIKVTEAGMVVSTPDRSTLCAVQTPQAFGRLALLEAHRLAREAGAAATDDAMLFERLGRKVAAVPGHYTNLKITTPEDLLVAELFLERRRREKEPQ
ncbi:2-C-methyl-D-erythritol 4-phosphate cytidylyltransferase [Cohnella candidum]|uniref:2-C-methyl-D-erythritol 4-phosphate cytidylyltransferase n=1 Tax=Cohnella candidum TaxID=2674991 RepID=A0A3G3K0W8_9BACL|nr:2-C-methyl-D-erythritol 4-phosphate cytidylyltransferase [Cohnella candidum]AYQ74072.1 2-C-methyl-D-erythritol 4-phosphate cytidylyltransferase [Cohnella candidum]